MVSEPDWHNNPWDHDPRHLVITAADVVANDPTWCCPLIGLYPCERLRRGCYCHELHLINQRHAITAGDGPAMKCEACERDEHFLCGRQTWCECDCDPEAIDFGDPMDRDIVGHKTFDTGETDPETGFPKLRHEPLTRAEANAMWARAERCQEARAMTMPGEQDALRAMFEAWQRLKELGWREGKYCPRDGTIFRVIELGSTGIFDGDCSGEWPDCTWTTYDDRDAYPSSQAPALFKLKPEDQAKYDARMAEGRERYMALISGEATK